MIVMKLKKKENTYRVVC